MMKKTRWWVVICATVVAYAETNAWIAVNLLRNSEFAQGLRYWTPWQYAKQDSNVVAVVTYPGGRGSYRALRIANARSELAGVQQLVHVVSGEVYQLRAACRSMVTNDSKILFGGRVALYHPPEPERQLVWTTEFNNWWTRSLVFTAEASGVGVVLVHMGYGRVASTGEFADVRLEHLERVKAGSGKP